MTPSTQGEIAVFRGASPKVRRIGAGRPWMWLAAGWEDFRRTARIGLVWALLFVVLGAAMVGAAIYFGLYALVLPLAAGFMLVAPILVVGLYEVSRRLESGEAVTLSTPLAAWRRNAGQIGFMGFVLGFFFLAWMRIAQLLFAFFFSDAPPTLEGFLSAVVFSRANIGFLAIGTAIGAALAALVFAISAVSVPMLLDRGTNVPTAIATSFAAVRVNPRAMLVWAGIIVLFVGAGMLTAFIGLIVALPLLAHATWHAYRDLVVPE
jgi:uncharacterized membrane protein